MKRIFLLMTIIGLTIINCLTVKAETTIVTFPTDEEINQTGGPQILSMSRNGRYCLGANYYSGGVIYDSFEKTLIPTYASAISNDGTAVVGNSTVNIHTGERHQLQIKESDFKFVMTTAISDDGRIVIGMGGPTWTNLNPCYWEDGEMHLLPYPTTEDVQNFKINGCEARFINHDGSVIVGKLVANPNTFPMIVWVRQFDGSYEYIDTWSELYEPIHGWAYDETTGESFLIKGNNPWMKMEPGPISGDGKTISLYLQDNSSDDAVPPMQLGFYHLDSGEIEVWPLDPEDMFGEAEEFVLTGISQDLTVVGITGTLGRNPIPFIKKYGEKPVYLNDAFPELDELQVFDDCLKDGLPYLLSGISDDGRYLTGYCTSIFNYSTEGGSGQDLAFTGYFIDRGEDNADTNGVGTVILDGSDEEKPEYFTIDGIKVPNPGKGLYIVKQKGKPRLIVN